MSSVNQSMSLFIPRVFPNISSVIINNSIQNFGLGLVERVDLVEKGGYNAAYVHFVKWNNTPFVAEFQERASNPNKKAIITYDAPWFWIVLENTSAKRIGPEKRKEVLNLRESFHEPLPIASGLDSYFEECEDHGDCEHNEEYEDHDCEDLPNVPFSVFEEIMWQMEMMQGEINELKDALESAGIICSDNIFTDVVTGNRFKRRLTKSAEYEVVQIEESESN